MKPAKLFVTKALIGAGAALLSTSSPAAAVLWTVSGATFEDGGILGGSFSYDADLSKILSFSLTVSGGDTAIFSPVTYTNSISNDSYFNNQENFFNFKLDDIHDRQLRISVSLPLTNAGGIIDLQANNFAGECFNCNPVRLFAKFGSITSAEAPTSTAVPEPASWAMMIGGFGIVGAATRRRQHVAARLG